MAGAFDLPISSSIFQIQSFVSPVLFGLSLCVFFLWDHWLLLYPTDLFFWFLGFWLCRKIPFLFTKRVRGGSIWFAVLQFNLSDSKFCIFCCIRCFSLQFSFLESMTPSLSNIYVLLISEVLIIAKKFRFYSRNVWRHHLIRRSVVQFFRFKVLNLQFYLIFLFADFLFGIGHYLVKSLYVHDMFCIWDVEI